MQMESCKFRAAPLYPPHNQTDRNKSVSTACVPRQRPQTLKKDLVPSPGIPPQAFGSISWCIQMQADHKQAMQPLRYHGGKIDRRRTFSKDGN